MNTLLHTSAVDAYSHNAGIARGTGATVAVLDIDDSDCILSELVVDIGEELFSYTTNVG